MSALDNQTFECQLGGPQDLLGLGEGLTPGCSLGLRLDNINRSKSSDLNAGAIVPDQLLSQL